MLHQNCTKISFYKNIPLKNGLNTDFFKGIEIMLYGHPHQTKVIRTLLRLEMGSDLLLYISKIKFFHFFSQGEKQNGYVYYASCKSVKNLHT